MADMEGFQLLSNAIPNGYMLLHKVTATCICWRDM